MASAIERVDPADLSSDQIEQLDRLLGDQPSLRGRGGFELRLPDPIFQLMLQVVAMVQRGEVVLLVPEAEVLTTKAAAEILGVSRPFLIKLLEGGEIPYHKAGTHRRIALADVREYMKNRDAERRRRLGELFQRIDDEGLYDSDGEPESPEGHG